MNVSVMCMSHLAALNASNKDFCPYLQTDDVHPASVGHTFLICYQL